MNARITFDFWRGALAAYILRELYMYSLVAPTVVHDMSDRMPVPVAVLCVAAFIAVHVFVLVAILLQRAPKAVFVCLAILAVYPFLSPSYRAEHSWVAITSFYSGVRWWVSVFARVAAAVLGYVYWHRVEANRPNQSLERTAIRRAT